MASYARLKKQLESLEAEVESARQAELLPVIRRIQREMAAHGILPADLGAVADGTSIAVKKVVSKRAARGAGKPKYKDPKSGLTWSGFGRAPGWISKVRDRTRFLIDGGTESQGSSGTRAKALVGKKAAATKTVRRNARTAVSGEAARPTTADPAQSPVKKVARKGSRASTKRPSAQTPEPAVDVD